MQLTVRQLMTASPKWVHPQESVHRCVRLMQEHTIRHVPVIDHAHQVVGIISQRDLIARGLIGTHNERREGSEADLGKAADVMTKVFHVVRADDPVVKAAAMMLNNGYSALPVIEHGRLVGIITSTDFIRLVRDHLPQFDSDATDWVD